MLPFMVNKDVYIYITGHFGDESLQAITCAGTDNNEKQQQKNQTNNTQQ